MKMVVFGYSDTYIESVEAFCKTVDVIDVSWYNTCLIVKYR